MASKTDFKGSFPEALKNPNNCVVKEFPGIPYTFGYRPHLSAGVAFIVLFFLAMAYHLGFAMKKKRWPSVILAYGAFVEVLGWAGRTWASQCPYNQHAYLMQIVTLIIAPVFFTAALYVQLGQLIHVLGKQTSRLPARLYAYVFVSCDVLSMLIQIIGATIAGKASSSHKGDSPAAGTNIVLAGVAIQLASTAIFTGLVVDFRLRAGRMGVIPRSYRPVFAALYVALACHLVRGVFRAAGLAEGWTGDLLRHERPFVSLDGFLMLLAVGIFVALDPARIIDAADLLPAHQDGVRRAKEMVEEAEHGNGSIVAGRGGYNAPTRGF
ncbi:glutamine synthetase/guanido kinase [Apiospora arundinis]